MPARIRYDVLVIDRSPLARNLYQVLFSGQERFHLSFSDEYQTLFKKSNRFRPDLLLINSNALPAGQSFDFPSSTILIASKNRFDLKESLPQSDRLFLLEKPFYPYDLLSIAQRLIHDQKERPRRGRPPGRSKKR